MKFSEHRRMTGMLCFVIMVFHNSVFSASSSASNYYPLALNNTWNYIHDFLLYSEKIVDTGTFHEQLYYGLAMWSGEEAEHWIRSENNIVYLFNESDSTEYILYNFNAEIGESWELPDEYGCSLGHTITLTSKNDTITTPAGEFICYHFEHQPLCMDAGIFDSWFAEGIGKVRYISDNWAGYMDYLLNDYAIETSVSDRNPELRGESYQLYQNYPNPFNSSTRIAFGIPRETTVTLSVFDITGRRIEWLVKQEMSAGNHEMTWNACNRPSGFYYIVLEADGFRKICKCILLN